MSYDSDVNIYTEDGRIKQVEYAMKAMHLGTTTVAAVIDDSVLIVSEKKLSNSLQKSTSVRKHFKVYDHVVVSFAGISADVTEIIRKCRNFCAEHESLYNTLIPAKKLLDQICNLALKFAEEESYNKIYARPFGVSIILGIYDKGPRLFCIDPSGSYAEYSARAIGCANELAEQQLEACNGIYTQEKLVEILKSAMPDEMTANNIEISVMNKDGLKQFKIEELRELI
ncbi:PSA5 [Enterospora canceri]|uniref:PSA5 n=1 Tax=Enterospora canceri TaxID=1081671 RepID=A0A1Y1S882_9MICR|nr:PSA5 [Enterospora canceri]